MSTACLSCAAAVMDAQTHGEPRCCLACGRLHEPPSITAPSAEDLEIHQLDERLRVQRERNAVLQRQIDELEKEIASLKSQLTVALSAIERSLFPVIEFVPAEGGDR